LSTLFIRWQFVFTGNHINCVTTNTKQQKYNMCSDKGG